MLYLYDHYKLPRYTYSNEICCLSFVMTDKKCFFTWYHTPLICFVWMQSWGTKNTLKYVIVYKILRYNDILFGGSGEQYFIRNNKISYSNSVCKQFASVAEAHDRRTDLKLKYFDITIILNFTYLIHKPNKLSQLT